MNGHQRRQNSGGVPPRWLKCPRKSEGFIANKFLVFKTPLSSKYDEAVSPEYRFYPKMVTEYVKMQKVKLGLWIDLTNTDRFYPKREVEEEGARYVKIVCRGHGEAPNAEQVKAFNQLCDKFTEQNPDDIIGVHCTHGFNRSGYLICAFLTTMWDWGVHAALTNFKKSRPPGIYKKDYINQLYQIHGTPDDPPFPPPEKPDWCYEDEEEEDDDGFATTSTVAVPSGSRSLKQKRGEGNDANVNKRPMKRKREEHVVNPTFMDGVPGIVAITEPSTLRLLQRKTQDMCEWRGNGFPGCQPVSMDLNNLRLLEEKPYMVSWKADGTRYLMLIDGPDQVYFIDRKNSVFHAQGIKFPYRKNLDEDLCNTLVDGEMVLDKVNDTTIPRYLIYDIIKFRGEEVGKMDFRVRLNCIKDELIGPRTAAMERGLIDRTKEPFGIRFKTFWFLEDTEKILNGRLSQELVHEPDGVIFQPTKEPYKVDRCDEVLKWKPPHLNTIDFRLKIVRQTGEGLVPINVGELYVGSLEQPFAKMKATKAITQLDGKIIECKYDKGQWVFLRVRSDKSYPNAFTTAKAICESISHPVTQDILFDFIANRRFRKP